MQDYVRARRVQIKIEAGRRTVQAFVPQLHAPGAQAEVDFGEVWLILAEMKTKCHMFTFRLSHSGRAVHRVRGSENADAVGSMTVEMIAGTPMEASYLAKSPHPDLEHLQGLLDKLGATYEGGFPDRT